MRKTIILPNNNITEFDRTGQSPVYVDEMVGVVDPISGNSLDIGTGGQLTVEAVDLDIRDLVFATDKVDVSGSLVTVTGEVDVNLQDQTTEAIFNNMCRSISAPYTLAADTIPGEYDIILTDATGIILGDEIGLFQNSTNPSSYFAKVLSISVNTLTMDTPLDIAFDTITNSPVLFRLDCDMAVNGATTPIIYSAFNQSTIPYDITRIIFHITDDAEMDDGKFGGIAALTRGCVLRKKNASGNFTNYFNVKSNGKFGELAYDKTYDDKAKQGTYGFSSRLTFGGQSKVGVVIRLEDGEELQLIIQDDLTELLTFAVMVEGHLTDDLPGS